MSKFDCGVPEYEQVRDDWVCPIDNPNEVLINDCKDCPYGVEREEECLT